MELLLILHIISNLILIFSIYQSAKLVSLKITIHNLPYFILGGLALAMLMIASFHNPIGYFIMGGVFSLIYLLIESFGVEGVKKLPLQTKILMALALGAAWIQCLAFIVFYVFNANKLNEKLKP